MKWKERGMVFMKMINKNYFQYLIKQHKRLLILINVIGFILIPFLTLIFMLNDPHDLSTFSSIITIAFGFIISFLAPIYLFSFLQKKKSTNLYFSLPIKKESLFVTTSLFSLFATIIPVVIDFIIAISIAARSSLFYTSIGMIILTLFEIIIYMILTQGLSACITVLCQNTFDSFIVNAAYLIAPCLLFLGLLMNASNCAETIMMGYGNYTSALENLIYYLSFPFTGFFQVFYTIKNNDMISFIPTIYWCVIMILSYVLSYRLFIKRNAEMSENHTQSFFMYPLLIVIVTFSLVLCVVDLSNNNMSTTFTIMTIAFIFVIYLIMYFVSVRKVYFHWKIPVIFLLLLACSFGFSQIYQNTKGFGTLSEYPSEEYDGKVNLSASFSKGIQHDNKNIDFMTLDSQNKNTRELVIQFQKELLNSGLIVEYHNYVGSNNWVTIDFDYEKSINNESVQRSYYIIGQKNIDHFMKMYDTLLNTIKTNKEYTCHHDEYSTNDSYEE